MKYVVESFGNILSGESVQVNVDNFSASIILLVGSSKPHLQKIAIEIFQHCTNYDIRISPRWIPRSLNTKADEFSKINDTDDWSINGQNFVLINNRFGPFIVDRFADNINTKLPRFNSKFYCPGSECVNAFTANWRNETNWLCPPVALIGSVLRHMKICKSNGTLLVPIWPSAYFWPLIYPNGRLMASFVKDFIVVKPYFVSSGENIVFKGYTSFNCLALSIRFYPCLVIKQDRLSLMIFLLEWTWILNRWYRSVKL